MHSQLLHSTGSLEVTNKGLAHVLTTLIALKDFDGHIPLSTAPSFIFTVSSKNITFSLEEIKVSFVCLIVCDVEGIPETPA